MSSEPPYAYARYHLNANHIAAAQPTAAETADRALVDWAPNRVWITSRRTGVMEDTLDLQVSLLLPSHYEYRVVDANGTASPGPRTP